MRLVRSNDALVIVEPATGQVVAEHDLTAPGTASVHDEHYDGPSQAPNRAPRPRMTVEQQFCALGDSAGRSWSAPPAIGDTRQGPELEVLLALGAAHGTEVLVAALARAVAFRRTRWR